MSEFENDFMQIGHLNDVSENTMVKMTIQRHDYLLIRYQNEIYVVDDRCPHMGASLSKGILVDHYVQCPLHKAKFDFLTGHVEQDAKIAFIRMKVNSLKTYEVKVENQNIYIKTK